ncbi:multidrug resistance-associated protein 5 [Plakobranchus ocellatus]|uniref:Multidrug resistance-associated protein 5 n=1 Tax=Plakobranchus ocellatus TaxID=259542 RepID=A0AAV4DMJ5_9GAST|nr:multidrug resistance-associated protein 5 [Plakobranchus ocellatus]
MMMMKKNERMRRMTVYSRYLQAHTLGEEYLGFKPASNKATHTGLRRYRRGLKNAIPLRTAKSPKHTLPLDTNGLINYMTFGWLTPYMWTVFRKGENDAPWCRT